MYLWPNKLFSIVISSLFTISVHPGCFSHKCGRMVQNKSLFQPYGKFSRFHAIDSEALLSELVCWLRIIVIPAVCDRPQETWHLKLHIKHFTKQNNCHFRCKIAKDLQTKSIWTPLGEQCLRQEHSLLSTYWCGWCFFLRGWQKV